jgi:hypothetical protein
VTRSRLACSTSSRRSDRAQPSNHPSATVLVHGLERQVRASHDAIPGLERELKHHQRGPTSRSGAVAIASQHVKAAIHALELARSD